MELGKWVNNNKSVVQSTVLRMDCVKILAKLELLAELLSMIDLSISSTDNQNDKSLFIYIRLQITYVRAMVIYPYIAKSDIYIHKEAIKDWKTLISCVSTYAIGSLFPTSIRLYIQILCYNFRCLGLLNFIFNQLRNIDRLYLPLTYIYIIFATCIYINILYGEHTFNWQKARVVTWRRYNYHIYIWPTSKPQLGVYRHVHVSGLVYIVRLSHTHIHSTSLTLCACVSYSDIYANSRFRLFCRIATIDRRLYAWITNLFTSPYVLVGWCLLYLL